MVYFQQSLFGKMSWERFHQITGWILEPSYPIRFHRHRCFNACFWKMGRSRNGARANA